MVEQARLEQGESGLEPVTEGWFVYSVKDAPWATNEARGAACLFESDEVSFPQVGFTIAVIQPGQVPGMYHREANQENFLVLAGECVLLIEGEERRLRPWDFVHCPPHTEHAFVGAGDGPCVIFMTGAREGWPDKGIVYPRSEVARRHGASVEVETSSPAEAYAGQPPWRPGPPSHAGLPWA
jgi:quercetin dioxygenase-like cupin family protein